VTGARVWAFIRRRPYRQPSLTATGCLTATAAASGGVVVLHCHGQLVADLAPGIAADGLTAAGQLRCRARQRTPVVIFLGPAYAGALT
jgi:hypothetical protein